MLIKIIDRILKEVGLKESNNLLLSKLITQSNEIEVVNSPITFSVLEHVDKVRFKEFNPYKFLEVDKKEGQETIVLAKHINEIVGFCRLDNSPVHKIHGIGDYEIGKENCWIGPVFVSKKYRNRGINSGMLKYANNLAYEKGISNFVTLININNLSSIRSFEKNGFKGRKILIMKKKLFKSPELFFIDL